VTITQAANSALSWRTSRKERNARITDAVTELVAAANAWVYATSAQEQDLFRDVATRVNNDKLMETLVAARAVLYPAQLEFGRTLARVRLTCTRAASDPRRRELSWRVKRSRRPDGRVVLPVAT
jgi:hypothetical protein